MEEKANVNLYKSAFDTIHWKNEEKIKELSGIMESMEGIVEKYLKRTAEDFPLLTDHSIVHSQMLWEYANTIVGHQDFYLNPLEGFVLNSVFLLHDAGMCYSMLNKKDDIKNDLIYKDYFLSNKGKVDDTELELEALFYTVRQNHGDYALRIAVELINNEEFLLANVDYRQEFGEIIGKIAKSHSCNINYIEREFGKSYTSPRFPNSWRIDFQKLSFILRCADAAHLDNLRTPKTLRMIEEIGGDSKNHWTFQKKIGFPLLEVDGLLVYSTNSYFKETEQKAWWYCYNALKSLDDELKNANTYFLSKGAKGFEGKGVKYISDPLSLGQNSIRTSGWDSINTTIRVSNPVHIAAELGGEKLYKNKSIAVRELIQNSIDAIHVHRVFTAQENTAVGKITIALEAVDGSYFLSITDNGIGMSQNLMTNELLDFGGSYWKSNKFYNDFKGLTSKGFESIGKFGIGFFSVFMLGREITVTSWKYGKNIETMRTLQFYDGLFSNPILRMPSKIERNKIIDRGTSVQIKLSQSPFEEEGFIFRERFKSPSLKSLVQLYVPSVDIEIITKEPDGKTSSIPPNSIDELSFSEIIDHFNLVSKKNGFPFNNDEFIQIDAYRNLPLNLTPIIHDNVMLGRLAILPKTESTLILESAAVILSKGIKVKELPRFVGYIFSDEVISISRDNVTPLIPYEAMRCWAVQQMEEFNHAELVELYSKTKEDLIVTFNLFSDDFPLLSTKDRGKYTSVSIKEFRNYCKKNNSFKIYQEVLSEIETNDVCEGFINVVHQIDMEDIVKKEDQEKLNSSEKIIRGILSQEWGDFEETTEQFLNFHFSKERKPYSIIWSFKKKEIKD